jgi:hypothetical protein
VHAKMSCILYVRLYSKNKMVVKFISIRFLILLIIHRIPLYVTLSADSAFVSWSCIGILRRLGRRTRRRGRIKLGFLGFGFTAGVLGVFLFLDVVVVAGKAFSSHRLRNPTLLLVIHIFFSSDWLCQSQLSCRN